MADYRHGKTQKSAVASKTLAPEATTDSVQSFNDTQLTQGSNAKPVAAVITVEDNTIRYAFAKDPDQSNEGHEADAGDTIRLEGTGTVGGFRYISAAAGVHASLKITFEY